MKKSMVKVRKYPKKSYRKKARTLRRVKSPNAGQLTVYPFKRVGIPLEYKMSSGSGTIYGDWNITQTAAASGLTNCYDLAISIPFKLANVTTSSDFTALFDRYCIHGVALKIMYDCNFANVQGTGVLPYITYAPDWDDISVPTSEVALQQKQYSKTKMLNGSYPIKYYMKPRIALVTTSAAGQVANVVAPKNTWLDCTQITTAHNGFKAWISNIYNPTGAQCIVRVQPTYYLRLKDSQ